MAQIKLDFARDVTGADISATTGYTIRIVRDDDEPLTLKELHAVLATMAADCPLQLDTAMQASQHKYAFVGQDYAYELIQWADNDVNLTTLKMGRAAGSAWHQALLAMRPDQDQQVVSVQGKAGPARLIDAGYLQPHPTRGHYIVPPLYAGYKMGWRPTDSIMIMGVPFPARMFQTA